MPAEKSAHRATIATIETIVMVGDVVGAPGLRALFLHLPSLSKKLSADIVVANGENALRGIGIGKEEIDSIKACGVTVITTGNHVWERKDAGTLLGTEEGLLRPANYPPGLPGSGMCLARGRDSEWVVINLQGREGLYPIDCPFRAADELIAKAGKTHPGVPIVIDFHAESPEEKEALAWHVDGRVSLVAGTHTHVQTADERILPKGTGYITDLGMTGPIDSVIGVRKETCIRRALTQIPFKMETAEGEGCFSGVAFEIDMKTGRCLSIDRYYLPTVIR